MNVIQILEDLLHNTLILYKGSNFNICIKNISIFNQSISIISCPYPYTKINI